MTHAAAAAALLCPVPALGAEDQSRLKSRMNAAMAQASSRSGAFVYDMTDRRPLYARRATTRRILASNTKLFTTAAALDRFGATGRFTTEVLAERLPGTNGVVRGDVYLRGGGDPTFGSASFGE
ncbi:MAG: hypothetical protein QOJ22_217, partial [Thermoleophilaceae bacterium]|nr:hypothetical protein [Thermoleophilaceae bacterium]